MYGSCTSSLSTCADVKVTRLGKVHFGPWREFEVYPSDVPGETYKRLVSVDGVPLARHTGQMEKPEILAANAEKIRAALA